MCGWKWRELKWLFQEVETVSPGLHVSSHGCCMAANIFDPCLHYSASTIAPLLSFHCHFGDCYRLSCLLTVWAHGSVSYKCIRVPTTRSHWRATQIFHYTQSGVTLNELLHAFTCFLELSCQLPGSSADLTNYVISKTISCRVNAQYCVFVPAESQHHLFTCTVCKLKLWHFYKMFTGTSWFFELFWAKAASRIVILYLAV